jgi:hypothetical protein
MSDTGNITALRPVVKDRTAAERSRRYRRKRKAKVREVPAPLLAPVMPVMRHGHRTVTVATTVAALALAAVSAGFAIIGMTAVFVGAIVPVIGMGIALELGKLSAVAWLGRGSGSWALRAALVVLVAVLMGLNAIGAYGFLAKAHIGHRVEGETALASRVADIEARIGLQKGIVSDLDRRIGQIDGAVEKAISKALGNSAMALADQQRKTRADLVAQRTEAAKQLGVLQVEKAGIDVERKVVEADLGPVRYLATLVGANSETAMRWFVLVVALLLDPAAVLLLLASSSAPTLSISPALRARRAQQA